MRAGTLILLLALIGCAAKCSEAQSDDQSDTATSSQNVMTWPSGGSYPQYANSPVPLFNILPFEFANSATQAALYSSPPFRPGVGTSLGSTMQYTAQTSPWVGVASQAAAAFFAPFSSGTQALASNISNQVKRAPAGAAFQAFFLGSETLALAFPEFAPAIIIHSLAQNESLQWGATFASAGIDGADDWDVAQVAGAWGLKVQGAGAGANMIWDTGFTLGKYILPQSTADSDNANGIGSPSFAVVPIQQPQASWYGANPSQLSQQSNPALAPAQSTPFSTVDPAKMVIVDPPSNTSADADADAVFSNARQQSQNREAQRAGLTQQVENLSNQVLQASQQNAQLQQQQQDALQGGNYNNVAQNLLQNAAASANSAGTHSGTVVNGMYHSLDGGNTWLLNSGTPFDSQGEVWSSLQTLFSSLGQLATPRSQAPAHPEQLLTPNSQTPVQPQNNAGQSNCQSQSAALHSQIQSLWNSENQARLAYAACANRSEACMNSCGLGFDSAWHACLNSCSHMCDAGESAFQRASNYLNNVESAWNAWAAYCPQN